MEQFTAQVTFTFEAETIESAGTQLRRLAEAAANAGFDMTDAVVVPGAKPINDSDWTPYGPAEQ